MGEILGGDSGPGILGHLRWARLWGHKDESGPVPGCQTFRGLTWFFVIRAVMEHGKGRGKHWAVAFEVGLERIETQSGGGGVGVGSIPGREYSVSRGVGVLGIVNGCGR